MKETAIFICLSRKYLLFIHSFDSIAIFIKQISEKLNQLNKKEIKI